MTQEQRQEIAKLQCSLEYTAKILDKEQYKVLEQEINRKINYVFDITKADCL